MIRGHINHKLVIFPYKYADERSILQVFWIVVIPLCPSTTRAKQRIMRVITKLPYLKNRFFQIAPDSLQQTIIQCYQNVLQGMPKSLEFYKWVCVQVVYLRFEIISNKANEDRFNTH